MITMENKNGQKIPMRGMMKARVLPDPVFAAPRISLYIDIRGKS
jgi:hypothetical protein